MGSGALTWIADDDGRQVENAASMALQASFGIPCDPIPAGKGFPCITQTVCAALHGGVTVCPVSQECARFLRGTLMAGKYKYDTGI